jgi:hypothetical protein
MKITTKLVVGLISGLAALCHGAEGLIISIEPFTTQITSESVPFRVVFTNASNVTISILKPVLARDLVLCVFDKTNAEQARSGIGVEYMVGYGMEDKNEYISLTPHEIWKTEPYDLFKHTRSSFRIAPDQTVRVSAIYSLKGKDYEGSAMIVIPAHDLEVKPEYISGDKALALAIQELKKRGFKMDALKGIEPTVQCVNGIYRVVYSRQLPSQPRVRGGGPVIISLKVDAISGNILQVSGGRR